MLILSLTSGSGPYLNRKLVDHHFKDLYFWHHYHGHHILVITCGVDKENVGTGQKESGLGGIGGRRGGDGDLHT